MGGYALKDSEPEGGLAQLVLSSVIHMSRSRRDYEQCWNIVHVSVMCFERVKEREICRSGGSLNSKNNPMGDYLAPDIGSSTCAKTGISSQHRAHDQTSEM